MSRSKLEEISVFPYRPDAVPGVSLRSAGRLLDELEGSAGSVSDADLPVFSPELRNKVLDMVAGTCRKSRVS